MALLNIGAGLSALGGSISETAGMASMQAWKDKLEGEKTALAERLRLRQRGEQIEDRDAGFAQQEKIAQKGIDAANERDGDNAPASREVKRDGKIVTEEWDKTAKGWKTVGEADDGKEPKAPTLHDFTEGGETVTREYVNGEWVERSRGSRFAPKDAPSEDRETWQQPVTEAGPDGKPIVVRYGSRGGRRVVDGATPRPTNRALVGKTLTDLERVGTKVEDAGRLKETFKDEFGGGVMGTGTFGATGNAIGRRLPGGDASGQTQWWQDYQAHTNQVRNQLFGAALTPSEQAEFEKAIITPNMSAPEARKNLARQYELSVRAAQRKVRGLIATGYDREAVEASIGFNVDDLNETDTPKATPKTDLRRVPAPSGPQAQAAPQGGANSAATIQQAREAIQRGAPREAVRRRLQESGITPPGDL